LLLVFCVAETAYTFDKVAATQDDASAAFLAQRGWMDRAVPYGAKGAVVLSRFGDDANTAATWWDASFWNYVVRATFRLPGTNEFEQGITTEFSVDPQTGRIPALDPYEYVIRGGNDTRFGLRGSSTVAAAGGVVLLKADRPYQANWLFEGKDIDSATVTRASPGVVTAFGDPGAAPVTLTLAAPAGGTRFTVASGADQRSGAVRGGQRVTVRVPAQFQPPGFAKLTLSTRAGPLFLLDVVRG
jgi:hypothetical protein